VSLALPELQSAPGALRERQSLTAELRSAFAPANLTATGPGWRARRVVVTRVHGFPHAQPRTAQGAASRKGHHARRAARSLRF
jgi:hypothetical protein